MLHLKISRKQKVNNNFFALERRAHGITAFRNECRGWLGILLMRPRLENRTEVLDAYVNYQQRSLIIMFESAAVSLENFFYRFGHLLDILFSAGIQGGLND